MAGTFLLFLLLALHLFLLLAGAFLLLAHTFLLLLLLAHAFLLLLLLAHAFLLLTLHFFLLLAGSFLLLLLLARALLLLLLLTHTFLLLTLRFFLLLAGTHLLLLLLAHAFLLLLLLADSFLLLLLFTHPLLLLALHILLLLLGLLLLHLARLVLLLLAGALLFLILFTHPLLLLPLGFLLLLLSLIFLHLARLLLLKLGLLFLHLARLLLLLLESLRLLSLTLLLAALAHFIRGFLRRFALCLLLFADFFKPLFHGLAAGFINQLLIITFGTRRRLRPLRWLRSSGRGSNRWLGRFGLRLRSRSLGNRRALRRHRALWNRWPLRAFRALWPVGSFRRHRTLRNFWNLWSLRSTRTLWSGRRFNNRWLDDGRLDNGRLDDRRVHAGRCDWNTRGRIHSRRQRRIDRTHRALRTFGSTGAARIWRLGRRLGQNGNLSARIGGSTGDRGWFGKCGNGIPAIRPTRTTRTIGADGGHFWDTCNGGSLRTINISARDVVRPCVPWNVIAAVALILCNLVASPLKAIHALPLESLASTRAGNDAFGLPDFLRAAVTELHTDILRKFASPLHGDVAEIPVHT